MLNQLKAPLVEALEDFYTKNIIPFDVPGHKRGQGAQELIHLFGEKTMALDVNSMPILDNLNYPTGIIKEAQELMADAFGAEHAFFTVNGTTLAVQVMILSACKPGDKILLPRNTHKSALNALLLSDAMPVFMQAEVSQELGFATGVTFETVKEAIDDNPDAKAIFLINPTYYGICSELKSIIQYAHQKQIAVLIDEAHGAHFGFHSELPHSAMELGADMASVSIHKTGGSLTQSSALLLNSKFIKKDYVQTILNIFTTTSSSYLLMASLDSARKNLAIHGTDVFTEVLGLARYARESINQIDGLYAFGKEIIGTPGVHNFDETKLSIHVSGLGITGFDVYRKLFEEYNIQVELGDIFNVLAIISLGDTKKNIDTLIQSLKHLSDRIPEKNRLEEIPPLPLLNPKCTLSPRRAFYAHKIFVPLKDAVGRIAAESIMVYPPGIPILAPGELVTKEIIEYIDFLKSKPSKLTDMNDPALKSMLVVEVD